MERLLCLTCGFMGKTAAVCTFGFGESVGVFGPQQRIWSLYTHWHLGSDLEICDGQSGSQPRVLDRCFESLGGWR